MQKVIFLLLLQIKCFCSLAQQSEFTTVWDLSKPGGPNTELNLGIDFTSFGCIQSNWDFGFSWETVPAGLNGYGSININNYIISGLPANAIVKVMIDNGNGCSIVLKPGIDKLRLIDVKLWGSTVGKVTFKGCNNLNISAIDMPSLGRDCKDMFAMDSGINIFTGPTNISSWDVSGVEGMSGMFKNCNLFNEPLSNWNMRNVKNTDSMFAGASSFNQPINAWDVRYDTSMLGMFAGAPSFNQSLSNWQLNAKVHLQNMLDSCGMDCSNYSSTMHGWALQATTPINKTLGAAGLAYGSNAQAYIDTLLVGKGWNIIGNAPSIDTCCFTKSLIQTACDSYYFNNQLLTTSGIYYDTIADLYGCDTIIVLNLTVNYTTSITFNVCKWPGQWSQIVPGLGYLPVYIYTSSGIYTYQTINAKGCDSFIYINVTINPAHNDTFDIELCKYIIFNNKPILSSVYYKDTFTAVGGCDSVVTMHVTQKFPTFSSFFASACEGMMHGDTFRTKSGLYNAKYTNAVGCDSTRQLSLIVHSPGKDTVQQSGNTLSSKYINAVYQWVDCATYLPISGATSKSFTPAANGTYAVITSLSFCNDTSNCVAINGVGITDEMVNGFSILPNPASHQILLTANTIFDDATIKIYNTMGQLLYTAQHINGNEKRIDAGNYANGMYVLQCQHKNKMNTVRFVKE
jgi:hypothetical protein